MQIVDLYQVMMVEIVVWQDHLDQLLLLLGVVLVVPQILHHMEEDRVVLVEVEEVIDHLMKVVKELLDREIVVVMVDLVYLIKVVAVVLVVLVVMRALVLFTVLAVVLVLYYLLLIEILLQDQRR